MSLRATHGADAILSEEQHSPVCHSIRIFFAEEQGSTSVSIRTIYRKDASSMTVARRP